MDKQILNFTANEQILTVDEPIRISTNKVNYIQASFDLGTNWSGFDSVRAIWFNDFNCISTVLDSLGNCAVPFEVMKRKGNVKVNLVGSISEDDVLTDRLTSYPVVAVIVDCTAQITGANTSPITPSEFELFAQRVHTDAERAEAGATASEQSAQNAHTSEQNASQSAQSAHDNKIAIEQAIAEVIQQIEDFEQVQVVVNTLPPSSQATSDFTDGVLTLGIPQGVKGDTGNGIQSIAKVSTSGLVDTYRITYTDGNTTTFTVTNGAKGDTGNGIQSIEKTSTVGLVDTYTITYTDGTTSTFTVTNGEKGDKGDTGEVSLSELEDATVVQTLSDSTPYNYRRTNGGNGSGHREYDEIVGASVGWNQLAEEFNRTSNGVTVTFANGVWSFSGNVTSSYFNFGAVTVRGVGHKILSLWKVIENPSNLSFRVGILNNVQSHVTGDGYRTQVLSGNGSMGMAGLTAGTSMDGLKIQTTLTDLTLLNSQIADYVYTLEQSTAGSGVSWLKSHFPKLFDNGYQPFDSGSIKSVSGLTAHEMVGKNVFDDEVENGGYSTAGKIWGDPNFRNKNLIKVIEGQTYYFRIPNIQSLYVFGYSDENYSDGVNLGSTNFETTIPQGVHYIGFFFGKSQYGNVYNHDICINLSDPSINGQYFPYEKHTYPLDSSVTLRGKYVLDNGQLKAVGDVWKSSGEITRNYGVVDLGTLTWTVVAQTAEVNTFGATIDAKPNGGAVANCIVPLYKTVDSSVASLTAEDKVVAITSSGTGLRIRDNSYNSNATAFKTAMSGVYLVYELATPTTESATPYDNPQWCDSHGTEEYVGSELPVGHNTDYPMTLIDTADGLSNGTYEPRITVANGKKTVTWVSV